MLACLDGYMNIAMEQTEEYVNGELKAKYGDTFIRGNNGARVEFFGAAAARCGTTADICCVSTRASRTVLYISTQKKR